ncbi:MAG: Formate dehydrogenase H [Deltaproteobacteria bacterium ADurb.BinA179]|nr:MAG: Formate dehydrogenase H [Deltaproteobacteria bacterium ADurb.BinA179]
MAGLATAFGSGAMTNSITDLGESDCFLITGTNTTENHPVIATFIKRAVTHRGAKLILADPRNIELGKFATIWLRQKPGTDVAWINGMMNVIISEGLLNEKFVTERTENFEALKATVSKYTPEYVEKISGIPAGDLKKAARLYAKSGASAIVYAMGITQHINGTDNVKSLANLAMLTGQIGRPGTGVNPLRGQNNVQGACDMACLPGNLPAYKKVTEAADRKPFEDVWGVSLPDKVGFTIPKIIDAAASGAVKALYVMGENPMMSDPDVKHVEKALKNLDLLVVQDIFLTETGNLAHVVLPTAGWSEKEGTYTNTERRVQRIRKAVDAPGEARPDWEIITLLANRLGANWKYASAKDIFEEVRKVTVSYAGITYDRIEKEGIQWPCPNTEHPGTQILHSAAFTRGKGLFSVCEHIDPAELPDNEYPLLLTTGRILYQYHTATMSRRSKGLVSRTPQPFVEIHPDDAAKLGIAHGDKIEVSSRRGSIEVFAEVNGRCDKGVVFIPFHYSEAAVNRLTHTAIDPVANIPEYKVSAVKIRKVA